MRRAAARSTLFALAFAGESAAQPAPPEGEVLIQAPPGEVPEAPDEDEPEPPVVPSASDTLARHFSLALSLDWVVPFGELEASSGDVVDSGPGFGAEAGFGVSRMAVVGAWGQLVSFDGGDDCPSCSARSVAGGAFVRYHLVQGVRFDPWMSAGLGFRSTDVDTGADNLGYSGIEWLRLSVGGDWYPWANVGLGPLLELDMGVYGKGTRGEIANKSAHWSFITGARIILDLPGK